MSKESSGTARHPPGDSGEETWSLPGPDDRQTPIGEDGLPVPPESLIRGHAAGWQELHAAGRGAAGQILAWLQACAIALPIRPRILDLGCGIGGMLRAFRVEAEQGEVWGLDSSARHVHWLDRHLSPPFHLAVTTGQPHLPFADGHFDLVYAGTFFTRVGDLAAAWLQEIRRVLAPTGAAALAFHDDAAVEALLEASRPQQAALARRYREALSDPAHARYDMLVIGGEEPAVFYRRAELQRRVSGSFTVLGVHPKGWDYRTVFLLRPKLLW